MIGALLWRCISFLGKDQPHKDIKSALDSIKKGIKPTNWENTVFTGVMTSADGNFKWTVTARIKSSDEEPVPTLQLNPHFGTKPIKIRYGRKSQL